MPSTSPSSYKSSGIRILLCLTSSVLCGCYSPYGYHGPYGGPGSYGQPPYPASGFPSGPVNGFPPGAPYSPGVTQPGSPLPTPLGPPSTYDNGGNGIRFDEQPNNAPTFDSSPSNGRKVPNPDDEPTTTKPTLTPTSGTDSNDLETPFEQTGDSRNNNFGNSTERPRLMSEPDPFEMPEKLPPQLRSSTLSHASPIRRVSYEEPQSSTLNPFGRDTKNANPTWLRGMLDYDKKQGTWSILYSSNPDPRDPHGGFLTLASHANLAKCRVGEVILAEGAIDASKTDARGKSVYVLDNVTPLTQ